MVCFYLFAPDSKESRSVLPWAFLVAGIVGILVAVWVIVYIFVLYPKSEVYVTDMDAEEDKDNKSKKNKGRTGDP